MATQHTTVGKKRPGPRNGNTGGGKSRQERAQGGKSSATGEGDTTYGLVSVLYHALQGAETYGQYFEGARQNGDEHIADFFAQCQQEEIERAERAKDLLASQLDDVDTDDDDSDDESALGDERD